MKESDQTLLEKLKDDIESNNAFANLIGVELLEVSAGYARARMELTKQCGNIYGAMHGGCAFSLADTVAALAVVTYGDHVTTLNASVNYMKPVADTKYLYCNANVERHGRKVSVVKAELTNDKGELLINGSFTYYRLQ